MYGRNRPPHTPNGSEHGSFYKGKSCTDGQRGVMITVSLKGGNDLYKEAKQKYVTCCTAGKSAG